MLIAYFKGFKWRLSYTQFPLTVPYIMILNTQPLLQCAIVDWSHISCEGNLPSVVSTPVSYLLPCRPHRVPCYSAVESAGWRCLSVSLWEVYNLLFLLQLFTDGTTNKLVGCYVDDSPEDVVLVRVYGNKTELIVDRDNELKSFQVVSKANEFFSQFPINQFVLKNSFFCLILMFCIILSLL